MIINIYKDIIEIFNKVTLNFTNFFQNKSEVKRQKANYYLIMFTQSEELLIYNAMTGNQILSR
jgi:hypothetical protein